MKRRVAMLSLAGIIVILDQGTKYLINQTRPRFQVISGFFNLSYVENRNIQESVSGFGKLKPLNSRYITSNVVAIVHKLHLKQGSKVEPDSVIAELKSVELEQRLFEAGLSYERSKILLDETKANHKLENLRKNSEIDNLNIELEEAKIIEDIYKKLMLSNAVSELQLKQSKLKVKLLTNKLQREQKILIEIKEAQLQKEISQNKLVNQEFKADNGLVELSGELVVKANMKGTLSDLRIEEGQILQIGQEIATVINNLDLYVELFVPQDDVNTIINGNEAIINTGQGLAKATVDRILSKVNDGVVPIHLTLKKPYPKNACQRGHC